MIPVKLRVAGFLSYLEPVEVDFTSIRLACISGANGAGKSSLLDAITWALFGEARRKDDAIIHQKAETAQVTLEFDYEGSRYRIMRAKTREKSTVLELHLRQPDGLWRSLTEAKVTETNQRIVDILRLDYETFTNASFFLQGKADSFAQQKPPERKRILASILGLDIWEKYRAAAAARRLTEDKELHHVDEEIRSLETELAAEDSTKAELVQAEQVERDLLSQTDTLRKSLDRLKKQETRWAEQSAQLERRKNSLQERRTDLENRKRRRDDLASERDALAERLQHAAEVETAYAQWQRDRVELERLNNLADKYHAIEKQKQTPLQTITGERSRIDTAIRELRSRQSEIRQLQSQVEQAVSQLDQLDKEIAASAELSALAEQLEEKLRSQRDERSRLDPELGRLEAEGKKLTDRIQKLGQASGAACPLCGQPLAEQDRLRLVEELTRERDALRSEWDEANVSFKELTLAIQTGEQEMAALKQNISRLETKQREREVLNGKKTGDETRLTDWANGDALRLAALESELAGDAFAIEARAEVARVDAELAALGYDPAAHEQIRLAEERGRGSEHQLRDVENARSELAPRKRELATLQEEVEREERKLAEDEQALKDDEAALIRDRGGADSLADSEQQYFEINEKAQQATKQVGYWRSQVDNLKKAHSRKIDLIEKRATLAALIDQLKSLERAFSKDGVPALLIEQALPAIEAEANAILDRLSNGSMSIRFDPLRKFKDPKRRDLKETLDIYISDANGERAYEMYSGGEAFRVNFALRLALSKMLAHRSGARLQTLVIDEGFGSQDAEGKQRLIEAINLVQAEFDKILVITHMEDLKDIFPARIEVSKSHTGSQVEVIS